MDKQAAIKIIRDTFERPFDKGQYVYFIKNLFNKIDEDTFEYHGQYITDSYKPYIKKYERIGKYSDSEDNKIDILIVNLKKETSLERARTMQRNFIAQYLKDRNEKDAAVVAFHTDDLEDWRFSLVKMEYKLVQTESGRIKAKEELTPARRYSFLVGKNEPNHTAQQQLAPLLQDDINNPNLASLESAFNIEKVTKEFFEKYRELYHQLKELVDEIAKKDRVVQEEFAKKSVDTVDFAKKLLGQIVFLYFLQKKGWLGVPSNKSWGEGDKSFLRSLFNKCAIKNKNFFNDYLEVLFYNTLNNSRQNEVDPSYSRDFDCRIPFLNGGLFEPINDYDWEQIDIKIPDELFSNDDKTKEGDTGTGILDVFDRYNFTVKEDEPLEKEVAIDPEMLGKVFENLLEVKDRKSKGSYYTPREIVHYMCQESLINYLDTTVNTGEVSLAQTPLLQGKLFEKPDPEQMALKTTEYKPIIPREDIEELIRKGEFAVEHDTAKEEGTKSYKYQVPESIRKNAKTLDEKLKAIKICDPAVGSGAFLVGMMHEIVKARNTLSTYLNPKNVILSDSEESKLLTIYNFKHNAIQNCLYGVDIDSSAVDIAKLRLWLSLIVDEEDIRQIRPLPNLDYKIIRGNSLLSYPYEPRGLEEVEKLKKVFFDTTNLKEKENIRNEIDTVIKNLFKSTETSLGYKVDFDFKINFSEVFHPEKGGFDVVIANPPYVEHKKLKAVSSQLKQIYKTYSGTADLYVYFYEKGINILRNKGVLTFISSNKFIKTSYGEKLRKLLSSHAIHQFIDFTKIHVFDALVASCVLIVSKNKSLEKVIVTDVDNALFNEFSLSDFIQKRHRKISSTNLNEEMWQFDDDNKLRIKSKIEFNSTNLAGIEGVNIYRGVTTGYNPAFIIDEETKNKFIKISSKNSEIIKPLLQGRNIRRWFFNESNQYLLQTGYNRNIKIDFHHVYSHLVKYEKQLKVRDDQGKNWWNLRPCKYYDEFEKEKIIWGLTADKWAFAYDNEGYYLPSNGYILTSAGKLAIKYILVLLNSNLLRFYFGFIGIMTAGGAYTLKHETISAFPIKEIPQSDQKTFIALVDRILAITKGEDYLHNSTKQAKVKEYEKQIDQMVYELYGLTKDEIEIVKGKIQ